MSGCGTRIVLRGQKPLALCDRCPCFGSLFPPLAALTFTNKAAQQMRERIAQMIPDNRSRYIRMGTFQTNYHPSER